jgi:Zn-dependent peptidase ImmA (M78 family)/transcriptional regulator with XRE-family HTH domain
MGSVFANVKPEILLWARESAGFSLSETAIAMGKSEDALSSWEEGVAAPTIPQLRKLSQLYKRPLGVFYLQEVPKGFQVISDFRRLPSGQPRHFSPALTQEIRVAHQRRELALELLSDLDEEQKPFGLSFELTIDPEIAGQMVREFLGFSMTDMDAYPGDASGRKGFNAWRQRIENVGVLVFQAARIPSDEASGFALAYDVLPAVVINRKDVPVRRLFSLAHEFVHLALRKSGVSDLDIEAKRPAEDSNIEVFCNRVAAAALMPAQIFIAEPTIAAHGTAMSWTDEEIATLANRYNVSREATLLRLLTLDRTTRNFYQAKRNEYAEEFRRNKMLERDSSPSKPIPRNMPQEALSNFGRPFVEMVLGSYYQDRLTLSEVSGYLGLRTQHVEKLQSKLGAF